MPYRESSGPLLVSAVGEYVIGSDVVTGRRVWTYELTSSPRSVRIEIEGGKVFVLHDRLECLDYLTGVVVWAVDVPSDYRNGTLLVVDGAVVVGALGAVACHDAQTGVNRWTDEIKPSGRVALAVPGRAAQADNF
ncbi:MAG: PQQ-binding-like beta-propeller repeat protein [Polyangiaceae bacterium]